MTDLYSPNTSGKAPQIIPAATVIIFRRNPAGGPDQILMVERSAAMRFAGGAAVFPGGRVDEADLALARGIGNGLDVAEAGARIAAIRETLEETGLLLATSQPPSLRQAQAARAACAGPGGFSGALDDLGLSLALDRLIPFARWLPMHHADRAFDTRFFLADLGTGMVDLEIDATENRHLFWASAAEVLELADEGKLSIIFPTRRNLERLNQFDAFSDCADHARAVPVRTITPAFETINGVRWATIPDDVGYPVTRQAVG